MRFYPARTIVFVLILLLGFSGTIVKGQMAGTGVIVGVVTDPSGAAVPGATVTATDIATNASRTTTTNDAGRYNIPNLPPGKYNVVINKSGFRQARLSEQVVSVAESRTLDVTLEIGSGTEVVEVRAANANTELQTLNSTIGNTVNSDTLSSLPSLGRDVSSFVTMQPGVSPDGSVGGTVVDQANFMLDGGNNSNDMDGSGGVYNPSFGDDPSGGLFSNVNNPISGSNAGIAGNQPSGVMPTPIDSVEEFKVATSNQTADFNSSSGMQVSIVTKRGTNQWHGTAYEYYLDNTMSANTWENNLDAANNPVPDWHRNWFGVGAGGPIIPKDILGGKTYIFALYQGARFPLKETYDRLVPSADIRNGILHDPSNPATTYNLNSLDPRGIGINSYVQQMWNQYMPLPNLLGTTTPCGSFTGDAICDGINAAAYRAILAIPQNDNFGVVRLDHDFGQRWHFMSSYRYYHLTSATDSQVDIGGFFPGDKLGVPTSLTNHPQVPWYLVVGMTTNVSSNVTNDFRYSFLRNWWAWGSFGDPAQFPDLAAALEPFGELRKEALTPYNVNTQQTRTRFWDGKDHFIRDDISWLKGTHFFQFGGQYQRNWNYHTRTDNGGGINYYPVDLLGLSGGAGGGTVDYSALGPAFSTGPNAGTLTREAAAVLGVVTQAQQAFTRSGSNLTLNGPLVPASDKVTIPYYNLYFGDSWRMKPSITLNYGLGWTLEMPPVEEQGKQVVLVDASGNMIGTQDYLKARENSALNGQVYNPEIGFALINNVTGHPKYPFHPFYGGVSPRVAIAWNPNFDSGLLGDVFGKNKTVVRGGYGRIYGRVNGVNLVLTPLLSPGLIQPVICTNALNYTVTPGDGTPSCGASGATPDLNTAFRIGTDGKAAPLPTVGQTLPQPFYPGIGGNAAAATASPLDPNFRPNSVDSFDISVQHQFTPKISLEVGAISRWVHHELQNLNINSVPYMMTMGGQQFQAAYAAVEKAMGCASSVAACNAATVTSTMANLKPQPFFEAALAGTGYCAPGTCTATLVANEFSNFQTQSVWSLWSDLDTGGAAPGFNFPVSMMNTAGQVSSNVTMSTSLGYGNYNAGFITFKMNDWHGITLQNNFTYSKALGTGAVIQATSSETAADVYNIGNNYGLQPFDRKFVDTLFLVYQPSWYRNQQGFVGHLLGGWTFSPIFTAGSGAPDFCNTNTGAFANGYSGGQDFGSADGSNNNTPANCVLITPHPPSAGFHNYTYTDPATGQPVQIATMFANPTQVFSTVRPLILGLDGNSGGFGQFRGLAYWNMNLGIKKNFRITERFNAELSFNFINVFNHNQMLDPTLNIAGQDPNTFGQLSTEGTNPRTMEFGVRVNF
ncbi:MAG TPA: carboxypeptidase-like regulatory domain-containing protein [Methylomirabilota bacterium]|nr:carboxypeptidase-like regulatory domain-containing protein [Methylomirabilota bacterium]